MQRRLVYAIVVALTALAGLVVTTPAVPAAAAPTSALVGGTLTDTTPPTVPTGLRVLVSCTLTVTLNWTASTDDVGVTGYDVYRAPNNGSFTSVGTTTTTSFTEPMNGASRYEVRARDAAGNTSAFTAPVLAVPPPCPTSPPPPDTQPPTTPGTPAASVTCGSVTLTWTASTDNRGVTGYEIWRASGSDGGTFVSAGTSTTTSFTQSGPGIFRFQVRARDAAGNTSSFTAPILVTVPACPNLDPCAAVYSSMVSWSGGFQGQVTVTNTGNTATTGWMVTLTFAAGHRITQIWGGRTDDTASPYRIRNESYNGVLSPGASTTFGFLATSNGTGYSATVTCTRTSSS
ncbi:cellulose binding domain-containing protein [Sphaerisporangium dianthi]|uniref:Cellulose binding domain-containing protein n=1 Tax=Sphaerisporangium dianthi TaxID=1436120 RepID=A0ABV9CB20_9ACTN